MPRRCGELPVEERIGLVRQGRDFRTCEIGRPRGKFTLHLRGGRKKDNAETQRALRLAEKKGTGRSACPTILLFGGVGFGCGVGVFLLEALDAAGSVY